MQHEKISVSENFKKLAVKAILSIVLFIVVYLILIVLAIGITFLCGYAGIMLIIIRPMFLTLMVGLGLISMGILVLIFLLKFIGKKHIVDRSHLIEITRTEEPQLFEFIGNIVQEVETSFPKRIYISADVNAAVFYDSTFWSMLLPVKKNLQIGVGLLNAVSVTEFKAIMAHEFGHFSQRSMKVGSYVYNVNQVIFNLLYDNQSYHSLMNRWANISGYFTFFAQIAFKITQGIQWVLRKVYGVVNLNYMGLSREMEFHADAVAAHVAGSQSLITSLLRLDLATHSFNTVLDFYNMKISDNVKSQNIYPQQQFVMNFLAKESKLPVESELPQVSKEHFGRFNKSKMVIKDQWASHPSTADRVYQLQLLNIEANDPDINLAMSLLQNKKGLQEKITEQLFATVTYPTTPSYNSNEDFFREYIKEYKETSFSHIYNCYYDNKNPGAIDVDQLAGNESPVNQKSAGELFSTLQVDAVYTLIALEQDIATLDQIALGNFKVKSFDYDGHRYASGDSDELLLRLKNEVKMLKEKIEQNDRDVFLHFFTLSKQQGLQDELKKKYNGFFQRDKVYGEESEVYNMMVKESDFIQHTTPVEIIKEKLYALSQVEITFKAHIMELLKDEKYQMEITSEMSSNFNAYLSKKWTYFISPHYDNEALKIMFTSMQHYGQVLSRNYFKMKKDLLDFQVRLEVG